MISQGRIQTLDSLRGVAILMVMVNHFLLRDKLLLNDSPVFDFILDTIEHGYLGVDLFFVLSGFLITAILIQNKDSYQYYKAFYIRRILRIFPLYYVTLTIVWVSVYFIENKSDQLQFYDLPIWFYTYLSNITMTIHGGWNELPSAYFSIGHFWSLAVEEQFYLLWPILVASLPLKVLKKVSYALIGLAIILRVYADSLFPNGEIASYLFTFCRLDAMAIGAILAIVQIQDRPRQHFKKRRQQGLIFSFALSVIAKFIIPFNIEGTAIALFYGLLILNLYHLENEKEGKSVWHSPILQTFGKYSYGLYIIHDLLHPTYWLLFGERLFGSFNPIVAQLIYYILTIGFSYVLAWLSWVALEYPILKLKKYFPYELDHKRRALERMHKPLSALPS